MSCCFRIDLPPKKCSSLLNVYNVLGERIITLVNEQKKAGRYEVKFNGNNIPSGVYFYQIQSGEFIDVKKIILLK